MKITYNTRYDAEKGAGYYADAIASTAAQEAGFPAPCWIRLGDQGPLKLPPTPTGEAIHALFANRDPATGRKITLRDKTKRLEEAREVNNHRASYEFTWAPTKETTILTLPLRAAGVAMAFDLAVWDGMQVLGRYVATRTRKNGQNSPRLTRNAVGLILYEIESRSRDPQAHAHGVLANATWDPVENCYKAIEASEIVDHKLLLQRWATARMRFGLTTLGYRTITDGDHYLIEGVPQEAVRAMSKRAADIEKASAELETRSEQKLGPSRKKIVALDTRSPKIPQTLAQAMERWKAELAPWWAKLEAVVARAKTRAANLRPAEPLSLALGTVDAVMQRHQETSAITVEELLFEALAAADGTWHGHHLETAIDMRIGFGKIVRNGEGLLRLPTAIGRLQSLVGLINSSRNDRPKLVQGEHPADLVVAAREVMESRDSLVVIRQTKEDKQGILDFFRDLVAAGIRPRVISPSEWFGALAPKAHPLPEGSNLLAVIDADSLAISHLEWLLQSIHGDARVWLIAEDPSPRTRDTRAPLSYLRNNSWLREISIGKPKPLDRLEKQIEKLRSLKNVRSVVRAKDGRDGFDGVAGVIVEAMSSQLPCEIFLDDGHMLDPVNEAIHRHLVSRHAHDHVPSVLYRVLAHSADGPKPGDLAYCPPSPLFPVGDVLEVVNATGDLVVGQTTRESREILISPKEWRRLTPIIRSPIDLCPGVLLECTRPFPGLRVGRTERILELRPCGAIILESGKRIDAHNRFFRLAYCRSLGQAPRLRGARIVVMTRKPKEAARRAIEAMSKIRCHTEIVATKAAFAPFRLTTQELSIGSRQFWRPLIFAPSAPPMHHPELSKQVSRPIPAKPQPEINI